MSGTLPPFFHLLRFERIDSTNEEATRLAAAGAPAGTLVLADVQTAGRGRRGRTWVSPPGNLYCSLVLRPACAVAEAAQLGFAASLAVLETCRHFLAAGAALACKWPNDVLAGGRKLAGLLLESRGSGAGALDWLVLGVGINLASYPPDTEFPATSVDEAGAPGVTPDAMLPILVTRLLAWYEAWQGPGGFAALRTDWLAHAQGLGGAVRVRLADRDRRPLFSPGSTPTAAAARRAGGRRVIAAAEIFPAA